MAVIGQLELQLMADVARLRQDMTKATGIVTSGAQSMQKALDQVRGTLHGLFGGLSAGAFAAWIKGTVDFQDELNDLNKTTDIAVGKLSGLSLMSKQTGSDLTGMAQAINKITMEMGKAPEKFARIGITAKEPLEAFKQLSDIFRSIEDPQLRAAVAAEALGKGWAAAAPALAEGSKAIDEMVRRGEELADITEKDTQMSDAFNDSLSELQIALTGTSSNLASGMLPLMTELVRSLTDVTHEANQSSGGFDFLTETMRAVIVVGGNVSYVIKTIATEIGVMAAQAVAFFSGEFKQAAQIGREWTADAEKRRKDFDAWEARMMSAGQATSATREQTAELTRELNRMQGAARGASEAALRGFISTEDSAKKAAAEAKKAADAYDALISRLAGKDAGVDADFLKNLKLLAEEGKKRGLALAEIIRLQEIYIRQQPYMAKADKEAAAAAAEYAKAEIAWAERDAEVRTDQAVARQNSLKSAEEILKAIQAETKALGMSNVERETSAALLELERTGLDKTSEAYLRLAEAIPKAIADREAMREHIDMWKSIEKTAHDVFVNVFEDGAGTFKRLGQTLKAVLLDWLYSMTVKKWIINIQANMSGGGGVGGSILSSVGNALGGGGNILGTLGSLFGGGGGGSLINGAANLVSSLGFGNVAAGMSGVGGSFASTVGAGLATDAMGATVAAGSAAASLGSIGATIGAAMPWIGAALAIASLLGGSFKGETRVGATYRDGQFAHGPSGGQIGGAQQATAATMESINAMLASLGSSARLGSFVSALEQSTRGKGFAGAGGELTTGATFGQFTEDAVRANRRGSMSADQAMSAYAEELKQATLQALQAANVPGILGDYLRSLGDIDKLTGGALDKAYNRIQKALTEKQTLEERLFALTSTEAEQLARARRRELDAIDDSNRAMLLRVHALEDEKRAQAEAAAAISAAQASVRDAAAFIANLRTNIGGYVDRLNATPAGMLSPEEQLKNAGQQFWDQLMLAQSGDRDALESITEYADRVIAAQVQMESSGGNTASVIQWIKEQLGALPDQVRPEDLIVNAINEAARWSADKFQLTVEHLAVSLASNFNQLDTSLDGALNFDELKAYFGLVASDDTIRELIRRVDANGDGVISRTEAVAMSVAAAANRITATEVDVGRAVVNAINPAAAEPASPSAEPPPSWGWSPGDWGGDGSDGTGGVGDGGVAGAGFADGGFHAGGWRWVGERGPELAYTGPERIFSHSDSKALMDTSRLEAQVEQLQDTVRQFTAAFVSYARPALQHGEATVEALRRTSTSPATGVVHESAFAS